MDFSVDKIILIEDVCYVTGTCDSGSILLGSWFLKVYRYKTEKNSEGFIITIGKEYIRDIKLKVKQIKIYDRDINELPKGMSGEILLTGEGAEFLQSKDILVGED